MTRTQAPSGTVGPGPESPELHLERRLAHPVETVWDAMTRSATMERWIGRWEGDPGSGTVTFFMTAEGEDVEPEAVAIRACEAPRRFAAETRVGAEAWQVGFTLRTEDDVTVLDFHQVVGSEPLASIGPGWEYYLDRLAVALDGGEASAVDWADYYPAMSDDYASLA